MQKTFRQGFVLALALVLIVTPFTYSMEWWAPSLFRRLEGIGDYQYKSWLYFGPMLLAFFATLAVAPGYRNTRAVSGLLVGLVAITIAGGAAFVALFPFLTRGITLRY